MNQTLADVTDAEWAEMAKHTHLSGQAIKDRIMSEVTLDEAALARPKGKFAVDGDCQSTPFSTEICRTLRANGDIILCGPQAYWSGKIAMELYLFGIPIGAIDHKFDARTPQVISALTLPILRFNYVLAVKPDRWCFAIRGRVNRLTPDGWQAKEINRTFFCFGEI